MLRIEEIVRIREFDNACRKVKRGIAPNTKSIAPQRGDLPVAASFISYEDPETGEVLYKTV